MKNIKLNLFVMLLMTLTMLTAPTMGQAKEKKTSAITTVEYAGKSTKFAVMVSDVLHFRAAIMTAEEMQTNKKKFAFEIVVVGELAKDLVEDKTLLEDINRTEALGVKIVVCENALVYFKVPLEQLDKRLKTTKNAWVYMFELKDKNYNTLSI